jgi:hypothetical protein
MAFQHDYSRGNTGGANFSLKLRHAYKNASFVEDSEKAIRFESPRVMIDANTYDIVFMFDHDGKTYSAKVDERWFKKAAREFKIFSAILAAAGAKNERRNASRSRDYPLMGNDETAVPWTDADLQAGAVA